MEDKPQSKHSQEAEQLVETKKEIKLSHDQLLKSWERNTVTSAEKLVLQFQQLREALQSMTSINIQCIKTYKLAVDNASVESESSIQALNGLIEKCHVLLTELQTMKDLSIQIKELKENLGLLENEVSKVMKNKGEYIKKESGDKKKEEEINEEYYA